jgi:hypothetical protein
MRKSCIVLVANDDLFNKGLQHQQLLLLYSTTISTTTTTNNSKKYTTSAKFDWQHA